MVESQVRTNDVSDLDLIKAIQITARESFAVEEAKDFAYAEVGVKTPSGRILMKARDFSKLAQYSVISSSDNVLIIAGAGGYSAEIIKTLGAKVTIIDEIQCAFDGIECVKSDLKSLNAVNGKKYDLIFVDGSVEYIPDSWFNALEDKGRIAVFVSENGRTEARIYVKNQGVVSYRGVFDGTPPVLSEFNLAKDFVF